MWKRLLLLAVIGFGLYTWWTDRPVVHAPGIVAPTMPVQEDLSDTSSFVYQGYTVTPLARFELEALVLAKEVYRFDREADLAPVDLALGWGRMSDQAVHSQLSINQSNRFYYWRARAFPIPRREIETSSANMHIIPADETVARRLQKIRKGNIVRIRGYLVRVDAKNGWHWTSSLTRNDTGQGACELILAKDILVRQVNAE